MMEHQPQHQPIQVTIGQARHNNLMAVTDQAAQQLWTPILGPGAAMIHRRLLMAGQQSGHITLNDLKTDLQLGDKALANGLHRLKRFGMIRIETSAIVAHDAVRSLTARQLSRLPTALSEMYQKAGHGPTGNTKPPRPLPIDNITIQHVATHLPAHKAQLPASHPVTTMLRSSSAGATAAIIHERLATLPNNTTVPLTQLTAEVGLAHAPGGKNNPVIRALSRLNHNAGTTIEHPTPKTAVARIATAWAPSPHKLTTVSAELANTAIQTATQTRNTRLGLEPTPQPSMLPGHYVIER